MPLKFDATLKDLAQANPPGFLALFDRPAEAPVTLLNVDLSTVTSSTDLVFGVGEPLREILHFDAQSSAAAVKHLDILVYNALLHRLYRVPVHSVLLLLRPQAAHSNQNGVVVYEARPGRSKMDFGYEIIRLWEMPAEGLLTGALDLIPLAPLGKLPSEVAPDDGLAYVIRRLVERVLREGAPDRVRLLLTSAYLLSGLRVPAQRARQLFLGVEAMRDSSTYQLILDEGRTDEARKWLLMLGKTMLGEPDEGTKARLAAIEDLDRLEELGQRLPGVSTWDDLLNSR